MLARLRALLGPLKGQRLCVAFSGGADSTALLALLAAARARGAYELRALHVNHQLQPQAASWARAARAQARRLQVPCKVLRIQAAAPRGESPEAAARERRYQALAAQMLPGEVLLTAHHLEDQSETLLLQLLRGAGLAGLAAMPERGEWAGGTLLRPLLGQSRDALRSYLRRRRLSWIEDTSNNALRYDRNYLRHEVLGRIAARWPAAARTLARAAAHLAAANALLDTQLRPLLDRARDGKLLQVSALRGHGLALRQQLLRMWLQELALPPADEARLKEMAGPMLAARVDAQPEVRWRGARVQRNSGRLHAVAVSEPAAAKVSAPGVALTWLWQRRPVLKLPGGAQLELQRDAHGEFLLSAMPAELMVQFRGDSSGSVKKLLQELRVPPRQRSQVPLIRAGAELIAVADLWLAPRLKSVPASVKRSARSATRNATRNATRKAAAATRGRFRWRTIPD